MIVSGSNVGDQWAEGVERRLVTELAFFIHLLFNFVHRDVPGALDHNLHVILPGLFRQLTESFEFGKLGFIAGIRDTAGAQTITERE